MFNAKLQVLKSTKVGFSVIVSISSLLILIVILGELYGIMGLSISVLLSTILESLFLLAIFNIERRKSKT
jgi:O-antigen/teichoic acid export membrane protein